MRKKIKHYDLWIKFQSETDNKKKKDLERKLVEIYYPIVQKIAYNMAEKMNWKVTPEELASFGVDGLYIAINKFSLTKETTFPTYSNRRIKGSMIDGMRKNDLIPRSVRINHNIIEKTRTILESKKGRRVRNEEILKELGIEEKEYLKKTRIYHPVTFSSLDKSDFSDKCQEETTKKDYNTYLIDRNVSDVGSNIIRKEFFNKLMGTSFSRIEQKIIYLYYYKDFTMDKIACALNLSESRVSQIHKEVLPRIQDKIRRNPKYFSEDVYKLIIECNDKDCLFKD
jgi:RNA polymerase sigma factor FliA